MYFSHFLRFRRLEEVARRRSQDVSGRSPRVDQRRMSRFVVSPVTSPNNTKVSDVHFMEITKEKTNIIIIIA